MTDEQKQTIIAEANWCLSMTYTASNPFFYTARLGGIENVLHTLGLRFETDSDEFCDIVAM